MPATPPRLFYVMGPSGAGKDSLIAYARARLERQPMAFAHRYVTRAAEAGGENHIALSDAEFRTREMAGCFAMCWTSHGLFYGVGVEIDAWMAHGLSVVVNGSRAYLRRALARYPGLIPVTVTATPDILRQRLQRRGREAATEIEERLARAAAFAIDHPHLVTIDNSGLLAEAGEHLVTALTDTPAPAAVQAAD